MKFFSSVKLVYLFILLFMFSFFIVGCGEYHYGQVINEEGEPVVDVKLIANENEATTNSEGYFSFRNLREEQLEMTIEKEGYKTKIVGISGNDNTLGEFVLEKQ